MPKLENSNQKADWLCCLQAAATMMSGFSEEPSSAEDVTLVTELADDLYTALLERGGK